MTDAYNSGSVLKMFFFNSAHLQGLRGTGNLMLFAKKALIQGNLAQEM